MTVEQSNYVQIELEADMHTPISIFNALQGEEKVLFESSSNHDQQGRFSFIATNPCGSFKAEGEQSTFTKNNRIHSFQSTNPLLHLREIIPQTNISLPFSFYGGAIGYFGYETAFYNEKILDNLDDSIQMPDIHLLFFDSFIIFDHLKNSVIVATIDLFDEQLASDELHTRIDELQNALTKPIHPIPSKDVTLNFSPTWAANEFCEAVERCKEHIIAGDIFQIVLSQRFSANYEEHPLHIYRKLRNANPSPYMYYLQFPNYTVLGTSPESLVKVSNRKIISNPIAGTRPRQTDAEADLRMEKELLADEKELAEHRMLVDLARNDIGKLCKTNSISIDRYMAIERYKYVMHIVSEVSGELEDTIDALDVIASCLPAGTVSGAPKIRAMQLIHQYEPVKRGVYAGAIGYISKSGDLDLALAIRTMVIKDQVAHVQAGAGVVLHSVAQKEFEETLHKARALLEVIQ